MSTIRIKPKLISSSDGFDIIGRGITRDQASLRIAEIKNHCRLINQLSPAPSFVGATIVHQLQKFKKKTIITPRLTPSGKPSKKPPVVKVIPTHWTYRVFAIPEAVVALLKMDGKKIVQHKHHWSIESIPKP